jgi:hypothetical protein
MESDEEIFMNRPAKPAAPAKPTKSAKPAKVLSSSGSGYGSFKNK